jgi:hypothetical protein
MLDTSEWSRGLDFTCWLGSVALDPVAVNV